jgi:hypothetical protein
MVPGCQAHSTSTSPSDKSPNDAAPRSLLLRRKSGDGRRPSPDGLPQSGKSMRKLVSTAQLVQNRSERH